MEITHLGHSSFRLKGKTASLVTDPYDPGKVGLKFPKISADLVTISHQHDDHNKVDLVTDTKMIIDTPGEFEVMGISVVGISQYHDEKSGELRGKNIVYLIEVDELRIVHLGDLGHPLSEKVINQLGNVDVLFVPIGGEYTINANQAVQVVRDVEPIITIPMHYKTEGMNTEMFGKLTDEKPFLSELGYPVETQDRLILKKELLGEEQKVVVLTNK
jgi:L-ascorbate metabolism protein UlaG (beta-lactamase superfamily)